MRALYARVELREDQGWKDPQEPWQVQPTDVEGPAHVMLAQPGSTGGQFRADAAQHSGQRMARGSGSGSSSSRSPVTSPFRFGRVLEARPLSAQRGDASDPS